MSLRAIGTRLFRHGQNCVRRYCNREFNTGTISDTVNVAQQVAAPAAPNGAQVVPRSFALRTVGLQVGLHARRILIDNVLNRVTNSLAAELRRKAAKRMLFGDSRPFLALVGISLASGTGILTKEEELEGVCFEIREAISKIKWNYHDDVAFEQRQFETEPITVRDLTFGKHIANGANAVVYAAKISDTRASAETPKREDKDSIEKFPLAVKMMFNYDIQSNGLAILKAMYKETIPARIYYSNVGVTDWEIELSSRKRHLPPHPNVVAMYSVFTDFVPELRGAKRLYPAALPRRIDPDGEGRNMSLFLIMKRYNCTLREYISAEPLAQRTSLLLFAQLLEAVAHLAAHGIAHRDLKADNLLLDTSEPQAPVLVVSDFGCCLAEKNHGLTVSYTSAEIDKGGNPALMAPEIIAQTPGTFSVLNYSKSDLWAAATIGYEIFGALNPFYAKGDGGRDKLRSVSYREEELPEMPGDTPEVVRALVMNLLRRNPNKRLDPEVAANVCQLFLWAPSSWIRPGLPKLPTSAEILQWLLCLTTKVLCEGRLSNHANFDETVGYKTGRRTYTEYLLISSFLVRAKLSNIRAALTWIHNNIYQ